MNRLTIYVKQRIVFLHKRGVNKNQIVSTLSFEDNIKVSRKTVYRVIKNFKETGAVSSRKSVVRRVKALKENHIDFIDNIVRVNSEITFPEICAQLKSVFGLSVSTNTVRQACVDLNIGSKKTRYAQTVRHVNKTKRYDYAINCVKSGETFDDVIFTDESTIKIETTSRRRLYKLSDRRSHTLKGKPKHPFGLHVWAGISRRGATQIHIFTGRMDSVYYQSILSERLVPFIQKHYPDNHRFMQDNDPKHVSKSTIAFMESNNINHWKTPPESPDMNPIENLWAGLKNYIRKVKKPTNKAGLIEGIQEFWQTVDADMCNKYINHNFKVIPEVIKVKGAASGY